MNQTVMYGIQPNGEPHIGNLLSLLSLKKASSCVFYIADLHSLTSLKINIKKFIRMDVALALACGYNNIMLQSNQNEICTICWIINCISKLDLTYYDKTLNIGNILYPNMMAADILSLKANWVVCGNDQTQHLERTQKLAYKLNNIIKTKLSIKHNYFPIPKQWATRPTIKSLTHPNIKMSKSKAANTLSTLSVLDSDEYVELKIKSAKTDCYTQMPTNIENLQNRIGVNNLVNMFTGITNQSIDKVLTDNKNLNQLKSKLIEAIKTKINPIKIKMKKLLKTPDLLDNTVKASNTRVTQTLKHVKQTIGLIASTNCAL